MKAELVELFKKTPGIVLAGDALDDLAEDAQAAIIKAMCAEPGLFAKLQPASVPEQAAVTTDETAHAVQDVFVTEFGATLFNFITRSEYGENYSYQARQRIVRAMIRAMLLEM
jgi:hypothetical protein